MKDLEGPLIQEDVPIGLVDKALLGRIDRLEAGTVSGWACIRDKVKESPLEVCVCLLASDSM